MPEAPEIDWVTAEILEAYGWISRSRQYVGMAAAPAPISPSSVTEYLIQRPSAICREEFEAAIFALDDEYRRNWEEQQEREGAKSPNKP